MVLDLRQRLSAKAVSFGIASLAGVCLLGQLALGHSLPPPPAHYVLDEPRVLSQRTLESLQTLFKLHNQATSEQIVFAIFNSLAGEDPVAWTNQIFQAWRIGQKDKDNGALLAIFWKEHKARIEVGYGLEPLLTDAKSKAILANVLAPELKAGRPDSALTFTALEILKVLQSPLIQNGEAERILKGHSVTRPKFTYTSDLDIGYLVILGAILLIFVLRLIFRPRGRGYRNDDFFGGGGFGGPSDFGGFGGSGGSSGDDDSFRGGGGSSGGGGASQDW